MTQNSDSGKLWALNMKQLLNNLYIRDYVNQKMFNCDVLTICR